MTGLRYYPDSEPGFGRKRCGRGFSYLAMDGTRLGCARTVKRLKALAVPPAYENVWFSPFADGHLQASGRDAAGRKQYIYHPDWRAERARRKFDQLVPFGAALPRIRRWIAARLTGPPGSRETAIAAVLALLDRAALRVGSMDYAAENGTRGATTLLAGHARVEGETLILDFPGKGGAQVQDRLPGARLAAVLEACQDLPGAALITHGDGALVRSEHLREVLSGLVGQDVAPKTFRTWNGTHAAFLAAERAATIRTMAEAAAERLHNTPAIARSSYIHPRVIALAKADRTARIEAGTPEGYRRGEPALCCLLEG